MLACPIEYLEDVVRAADAERRHAPGVRPWRHLGPELDDVRRAVDVPPQVVVDFLVDDQSAGDCLTSDGAGATSWSPYVEPTYQSPRTSAWPDAATIGAAERACHAALDEHPGAVCSVPTFGSPA